MAARQDGCSSLLLSFFLHLFLCVFVVRMYCTALYMRVTVLHWGQPVIQPRASLTEQHKKWEKNNIVHVLCPTSCYYYCGGWQVRGRVREREPGLMEEEEMKLHLFWWLTNDFEMRVDLTRRQNHFPNNTAWSLNKQNWDTDVTQRRPAVLRHQKSLWLCVCVYVCVTEV